MNLLRASGNDCQKDVGVGYSGSTRNERNKELAAARMLVIEERVLGRDREGSSSEESEWCVGRCMHSSPGQLSKTGGPRPLDVRHKVPIQGSQAPPPLKRNAETRIFA